MIKIAVDVGTTNIDMAFYDMDKDIIISEKSFHNRQSLYGRDVINRINTVKRDKSFIAKLKALVTSDIIAEADIEISKDRFKYSDINEVCLSGNTTMISILLDYDISNMGESPYPTKLKKSVVKSSYEIFGKDVPFDCDVILTGCASAFIGGDILSGYNYLNLDNSHNFLFIDLGTNGEMILNNKGILHAASAACGPAFEASLKRQNVYGSTALDAVSLLLATGKLSYGGILKDEYIEKGVNINNIHITQDIIREILLAKAAIISCMEGLIKNANLSYDEIDKAYLAGGFGSFLNIENAVKLGLFPKKLEGKITVCGNTSLLGALLILKDNGMIERIDRLSESIEVVSLTELKGYSDSLIDNMFFKEI